jgi:hypothetical protein
MLYRISKAVFVLLSLLVFNSLLSVACHKNIKNTYEEDSNSFHWKQRLTEPGIKKLPLKKQDRYKKMDLDLLIIPEKKDALLNSCTFYIEIGYCYGEMETIYSGLYKNHILLKSVPYLASGAGITFMAYNAQTKIFYSWKSKRYHEIFINKPLAVELYDEYNIDADAWFKIYPR